MNPVLAPQSEYTTAQVVCLGLLLDAGALPPAAALAEGCDGDDIVRAREVLGNLRGASARHPDVENALQLRGYSARVHGIVPDEKRRS